MDDDPEPAEDERAVELSTISAIFPELVLAPNQPFKVFLEIIVTPAKAFPVAFPALARSAPPSVLSAQPQSDVGGDGLKTNGPQTAALEIRHLSYLPPLQLEITLPDAYPSDLPPQIQLNSQSGWLPKGKLKELESYAYTLWENAGRSQVVYDYIDYLQQAAENGFGLVENDESILKVGQNLEIALFDYDSKMHRENFEKQTFDCGVCLGMSKSGWAGSITNSTRT